MKELINKLNVIQSELKAPKGQYNKFGDYNYRSCEDILEAVKPLLKESGLILLIKDEIVHLGDRYYVKATCTLYDEEGHSLSTEALARETEAKKKMDESQITGAASSYARKYALNGLFAIDDNKDADTQDNRNTSQARAYNSAYQNQGQAQKHAQGQARKPQANNNLITPAQLNRLFALAKGQEAMAKAVIDSFGYKSSKEIQKKDYEAICNQIEANMKLVEA